jgi:hypothetical protein
MAAEASPELLGNAPDKPHHPPNPNLNFIWLYATIGTIFVISVTVKTMTVIFKKRRDKKRDPDLERQQLEPFQKWWYPWRYDKKGRKISGMTSDGTGESSVASSQTVVDTPPQLPPLAHHRESGLDRLVYRRSDNATDNPPASPALHVRRFESRLPRFSNPAGYHGRAPGSRRRPQLGLCRLAALLAGSEPELNNSSRLHQRRQWHSATPACKSVHLEAFPV